MRQSSLTADLRFLTGQAAQGWGESDWFQSHHPQASRPQEASGTSDAAPRSGRAALQGLRVDPRPAGAPVRRGSALSASPTDSRDDGFWEHVLADEADAEAEPGAAEAVERRDPGACEEKRAVEVGAPEPRGRAATPAGARRHGHSGARIAAISRCAAPPRPAQWDP